MPYVLTQSHILCLHAEKNVTLVPITFDLDGYLLSMLAATIQQTITLLAAKVTALAKQDHSFHCSLSFVLKSLSICCVFVDVVGSCSCHTETNSTVRPYAYPLPYLNTNK